MTDFFTLCRLRRRRLGSLIDGKRFARLDRFRNPGVYASCVVHRDFIAKQVGR